VIVAVHTAALNAAYGSSAWSDLRGVVNRYTGRLIAAGVPATVLYLDNPSASGLSGSTAAAIRDASSAAALIRAAALASSPRPSAVLLLGGEEVLPMFRVPRVETVVKDTDPYIPTDNPYGSLSADSRRWADPELAVGRITAGVADGHMQLAAQLERAIELRLRPAGVTGSLVLSNLEWLDASTHVASHIAELPRFFQSAPHYRLMLSNAADLSRRVMFVNLHGMETAPGWFGGSESSPWQTLTPAELASAEVRGSVVFACNCYGALIAGRSAEDSVALNLMRRGASGFAGSTGYALGATDDKVVDYSEELARQFFIRLAQKLPAGVALHRARRSYFRDRFANGGLNNCDYKTVMQFVFFGDPLL
jgi:hypothetical protein